MADGHVRKSWHAGQHREGRACLLHTTVVSVGCSVLLHCVLLLLQVAYDQLSPLHAARNPAAPGMSQFVPPVLLLHGTTDKSVPFASSLLLDDALQAAGVDTRVSAMLECVCVCAVRRLTPAMQGPAGVPMPEVTCSRHTLALWRQGVTINASIPASVYSCRPGSV